MNICNETARGFVGDVSPVYAALVLRAAALLVTVVAPQPPSAASAAGRPEDDAIDLAELPGRDGDEILPALSRAVRDPVPFPGREGSAGRLAAFSASTLRVTAAALRPVAGRLDPRARSLPAVPAIRIFNPPSGLVSRRSARRGPALHWRVITMRWLWLLPSQVRVVTAAAARLLLGQHFTPVLSAIEAAHVRWHSQDGPDELANAIALCSLHALFDCGVLGLSTDLRVTTSPLYIATSQAGQAIDAIAGQLLPNVRPDKPSADVIHVNWHTIQVFKRHGHGPHEYEPDSRHERSTLGQGIMCRWNRGGSQ
jgi:hypothetical protein